MAFIELKSVEKFFGEQRAIKGIDLTIEKGEFVVFVGPSGCGKSTLLRLIAGLETVDGGSVHLDGAAIDCFQPGNKPQQRRLAASRRPYKYDELALLYGQVDALDGALLAEEFFHAFEFDKCHARCSQVTSPPIYFTAPNVNPCT